MHFDFSLQQFDTFCMVGKWISFRIERLHVPRDVLTFDYICLPKFEQKNQKDVYTREGADGRLQVFT